MNVFCQFRRCSAIELSARQQAILDLVAGHGPVTSRQLAEQLKVSRAALRADLAVLTMSGLLGARPRVGYYVTGKKSSDIVATALGGIRIAEVLSIPIVLRDDCSVYDAIVHMFVEDVGTLFIVNADGFLEGLVSRKDLLKACMGGKPVHDVPVRIAMTRMPNIIVTTPQESVVRASQKLLSHQVDALPVVEPVAIDGQERYKVVGRFTKTNVTNLFVRLVHDQP